MKYVFLHILPIYCLSWHGIDYLWSLVVNVHTCTHKLIQNNEYNNTEVTRFSNLIHFTRLFKN